LDFPKRDDAETEHLVGDIFDFWKVRRGPIWTQSHNDVIQKLLRKSRKGSRIVYIPDNDDEAFREYCGLNFGSIELRRDAIFEMDQPPPQLGTPQVGARLLVARTT
jgi:UDP-2,3-diacylglucosamine pyrophosphatase LpxH